MSFFSLFSNVGCGRDDTLHALVPGKVAFSYMHLSFHARKKWRKFVHVLRDGETLEQLQAETDEKSRQMQQLVALHRKGVWLPSVKALQLRSRARAANQEKIAAQHAALDAALAANEEEAQKLKQHPIFKLIAENEARKKERIMQKQAREQAQAQQTQA